MFFASLLTMALATLAQAACPSAEAILEDLTCSSAVTGRVSNSGTSDLGGTCAGSDCYTCGDPYTDLEQTSAEDVYAFTCQTTGDVTLEISGLDCDLDMYILDDTCDPDGASCVEGSTQASTTTDSVTFTCSAGDTYYLVIEGYGFGAPGGYSGRCAGANDGDYTLSFDVSAGTGCSEDCDNGLDDDLDGDVDCADSDCASDPVCGSCDNDGDGVDSSASACGGLDCDDNDASVLGPSTWYSDADDDGFGGTSTTSSCSQPSGYVATSTDCDDADDTVYPGAPELCDGLDNDCDGTVDEGGGVTWYEDADGDGYGDSGSTSLSCSAPRGFVADDTDCDDGDSAVNPGADEECNGIDDDCDGTTDEDDAIDATTWYLDADGDGEGDANVTDTACDVPSGYVSNADDCYDDDAAVSTSGTESADGVDQDCDGTVDEGTTWYDDDGDGVTEDGGDCDDTAGDVSPMGTETCDGEDDDCDGVTDEDTECSDDDGDGTTETEGDCNDGDAAVSPTTAEIASNGVDDDCNGAVDGGVYDPDGDGYTAGGGDCDDADATSYPGANELPDGADNDCDNAIDEGTTAADDDGDGFSEEAGDCNDADAATNPDATETVNGLDDDCDGTVDEGSERTDDDGDGFSEEAGDCDDADAATAPGATESENAEDDDCDGTIDEGTPGFDDDGDGYTTDDCDDADGWTNPGRADLCDGVDNNCDGKVDEGCEVEGLSTSTSGDCGCASGSSSAGLLPALLALVALRRRARAGAFGGIALLASCTQDVSVSSIPPTLTVQPGLLDFGDVAVGESTTDAVSVIHVGGKTAEVLSVDLTGDFFALDAEMPDVPPDGTAALSIAYAPTEAGWHEGAVTITYNNTKEPTISFVVRGHAVSPSMRVYPSVLDFGVVLAGEAGTRPLTLANEGDTDITLSAATFANAAFSLSTTLPATVPAGTALELVVRYAVCPQEADACAPDASAVASTLDLDLDVGTVTLRANDCTNGTPDAYDVDADGFSSCGGDCDDHSELAHPGGAETADGTDEDCDGIIDEGTTAYDDDGDGFSEDDGDCADGTATVSPGAPEAQGNGVDDDCDGIIDQGSTDADTDGYDPDAGGDCDDADATVYPNAPELEDGQDNDCDGTTDEGTSAYDDDRDGYTEKAGDCDDTDAAISPADAETANHADDDCDGTVDEGTANGDDDGDGFTETGGDCDDADADVSPAAPEVRDGIDNDCDGTAS